MSKLTENIIEIAIKQQAFSCALSALGCTGNVVSAKAEKIELFKMKLLTSGMS